MARQLRAAVVHSRTHFRDDAESSVPVRSSVGGFEVVGGLGSAESVARVSPDRPPDIVLLDISTPGCTSEAARSLVDECSTVRTITLGVAESQRYVAQALAAAAKTFLPNGTSGADLISAILAVSRGASYVMLGVPARVLMEAIRQQQKPTIDEPLLTDRERQVLAEVSRGLTNKEIARKLVLSEKTIKNCMTHIMQKLGVRNRVEAVLAVQNLERTSCSDVPQRRVKA